MEKVGVVKRMAILFAIFSERVASSPLYKMEQLIVGERRDRCAIVRPGAIRRRKQRVFVFAIPWIIDQGAIRLYGLAVVIPPKSRIDVIDLDPPIVKWVIAIHIIPKIGIVPGIGEELDKNIFIICAAIPIACEQ